MAAAARLRGVYVEHRPAIDVIARHSAPDALIYADPPYLAATRTGRERSRGADYTREADAELDHRQLAEALHASKATVLVSGYDSPLYAELYGDWHRLNIPLAKPSANHSADRARHAVEVVWSNRPLADAMLGELPLPLPVVTKAAAAAEPRNETPARAVVRHESSEASSGPRCEVCGQEITRARTGRRPRFCGDACRQKNHRRQRRAASVGSVPSHGDQG